MFWLLSSLVRAVTSVVTARTVVLVDEWLILRPCSCGCPALVHEHYRAGSDCGRCGPSLCPRYRFRPRANPWRSR